MIVDQNIPIEFDACLNFIIPFHNRTYQLTSLINQYESEPGIFSEAELVLIEEAFLVKHVAEWEIFIQNIFSYCLSRNTSALCNDLKIELPKVIGFNNAYTILNGVDFISLTSSDKILNLAKRVLTSENNPFICFEKSILKNIDEVYALRNYLVHKSVKSKDRLMLKYKNLYQRKSFVKPGVFLREKITEQDMTSSKSQLYYGVFLSIAVEIWKFIDESSYRFVYEDEDTKEGFFKGMEKMRVVFEMLSKSNNLE